MAVNLLKDGRACERQFIGCDSNDRSVGSMSIQHVVRSSAMPVCSLLPQSRYRGQGRSGDLRKRVKVCIIDQLDENKHAAKGWDEVWEIENEVGPIDREGEPH